jgi:hypothetical protein
MAVDEKRQLRSRPLRTRIVARSKSGYAFPLLDHCLWFRCDRRYVAIAGQPYLSAVDIAETRAGLGDRGLVLHIPPDPLASLHYRGWTLFVVVTRPGVVVRFLPEQDGHLKSLLGEREPGLSHCSHGRASGGEAMIDSAPRRSPAFKSRLRLLSIVELERMSPSARARREALEEAERQAWLEAQRRGAGDSYARQGLKSGRL